MSRIISRYTLSLFLTNMNEDNVINYGSYQLDKDAFNRNIERNIDNFIDYHQLEGQDQKDFREAVSFIRDGLNSYITKMDGLGTFEDNRGFLQPNNRGHQYAAKFLHSIANKQGSIKSSKKQDPIIKQEEETAPLFNPAEDFVGSMFEKTYNGLGNDKNYIFWKTGLNTQEDINNKLLQELSKALTLDYSKYDFSKSGITQETYINNLHDLHNHIAQKGLDEEGLTKMSILGFRNPSAFVLPKIPTWQDRARQQGYTDDGMTWIDPNGNNTLVPIDSNPLDAEQYQEQPIDTPEDIVGNGEEIDIEKIGNNYKDFINTFAPTLATLGSVVNPEPISGTIMGLTGDIWNAYNNSQDQDGFTLGDTGELLLNLLGTAAGAIPYVGDFVGNIPKLYKGFRNSWTVTSRLIESLAAAGILWYGVETWNFIKNSLVNIVNKDRDDITKEDWANALNAITEIIQLYKNIKAGKIYSDAKRSSKLNDAVIVRGKDGKKHILTGQDAIDVRDLDNLNDVKDKLKDFGFEPIELPKSNKNIYNPDLLKREAGDGKFSRARGWAERQTKNTEMNSRGSSEPSTSPVRTSSLSKLDALRSKVKGKLQADGVSEDDIKQIDALIRNLNTNKSWYNIRFGVPTKEFDAAVGALINKGGYSRDAAIKMLKEIGAYEQGGILKAQNGTSVTGTPRNSALWYGSIGTHFMNDLIDSVTKGTFTYQDVNMMQERHHNIDKDHVNNVNNPKYNDTVEQYYKDINEFGFVNNKGIRTGETNGRYKTNSNPVTGDTYNEDPTIAWKPDGYYSGRGQDRMLLGRQGDYTDKELQEVTDAWKKVGYEMFLDTNNYYHLKPIISEEVPGDSGNPDVVSGNPDGVSGNEQGQTGIVSLPGSESTPIAPTGDPMSAKKSADLQPLYSLYGYYQALRNNEKVLDITESIDPLLYDPVEHHRSVYGNLRAIAEGNQQAARLASMASRPLTSDGSLQTATQMDAINQGMQYREAGLKADDEMARQTSEQAWQQEKENKNTRHQVAMKNRENIYQTDTTKLQARANYHTSNYQSLKNLVDEFKAYYIVDKEKNDRIQESLYSRNLQQDIYKNPQNYMPGWNTYHDEVWKKGISGKPLSPDEQEIFNSLKEQATNAYYSNLYFNTQPLDTDVSDIKKKRSMVWDMVNSNKEYKKGGKITNDVVKAVLAFLKESNKNYNKAIDRSNKGMYNHLRLQVRK